MDPLVRNLLDGVKLVTGWVRERLTISQPPQAWVIIATVVILTACCAYRPVWIALRHGVTIIHEMGHVTMGWLWGRRIEGVSLHTDTSGLTITAGKDRGLGVLMTYLAGYTAPPLVGLALIWASLSGWSGSALMALVFVLIATFWLLRNLFGLITVSIALALSGWVLWKADAQMVTTYVVAVGIFLLLAACRGAFDLWAIHDRGEGGSSDASMAAQHSVLPARFWVWFFGVVSALCTIQASALIALALA